MTKAEEIVQKWSLMPAGRILSVAGATSAINEALEWAAQVASNLECGNPTPRCTIAARIRAGKSEVS